MDRSKRLIELGIKLPEPPKPISNYIPYTITGDLIYVSGQGPTINNENVYTGKVGKDITREDAYKAARICGLNILSILKEAAGDLNRISRIIKINGYVNSVGTFTEQPYVVNGVSDLMVDVFGEFGKHSRTAISVYSLPMNIPVEIEMIAKMSV